MIRKVERTVRRGFTLIELLVATALCVLIMSILAAAFSTSLSTMSLLKSVVGLSEQLRSAETVMKRDLSQQHLEDENGQPVRVSNAAVKGNSWVTPKKGYFWVRQRSQPKQGVQTPGVVYSTAYVPPGVATDPYLYEGFDDGQDSYRATDHEFAFTVKLSGKTAETAMTKLENMNTLSNASVIAKQGNSLTDFDPEPNSNTLKLITRWYEVAYFLRLNNTLTADDNNSTPLPIYTLYRRIRVIAPVRVQLSPFEALNHPELSSSLENNGGPQFFTNTPESVTLPGYLTPQPAPAPGAPAFFRIMDFPGPGLGAGLTANNTPSTFGSDVVLNNVISMQVRIMTDIPPGPPSGALLPGDTYWNGTPYLAGPSRNVFQYHDVPPYTWNAPFNAPHVYDTAFQPNPPLPMIKPRLKAIQIHLRVYDGANKNKMSRQITIVQDL